MDAQYRKLTQAVYAKRPKLKEILEKYGQMPLCKYAQTIKEYTPPSLFDDRRKAFLGTLDEVARPLLGEFTDAVLQELNTCPVVNTGDHHGPLLHPMLISGNLVYTFDDLLSEEKHVCTVFAFGDIPLNNECYPRGILFTERKEERRPAGIPLFSDKQKHSLVAVTPAYTADKKDAVLKRLQDFQKTEILSTEKADITRNVVEEIFFDETVLSQPDYASQATVINSMLWQQFFAYEHKTDLAYIQVESIINAHLQTMLHQDTALTHVLLNAEWRKQATSIFDGIPGAWDTKSNGGTAFFWGVDAKGRAVSLHEEEGYLVGQDIRIELTANSLADALKSNMLVPNLWTSFAVIAFYAGFRCFGGFMQTDYLARMQQGWMMLLTEQGLMDEAEAIASLPCSNYCIGPNVFFVEHEGECMGVGGLDLIEKPISRQQLECLGEHILEDLTLPGLPLIYYMVYANKADLDLRKLTADQIIRNALSDLILP